MKKRRLSRYILSLFGASFFGALLGFLIFKVSPRVPDISSFKSSSDDVVAFRNEKASERTPDFEVKPISYNKFILPKSGKVIYVDTDARFIAEYSDGKMVDSFKIVSLNNAPRIAAGEYKIIKKDLTHKSTRTGEVLPNVVGFAPNYFIYGLSSIGRQSKGKVSSSESVGLDQEDSSKLFAFAEIGTKTIVASSLALKDLKREDIDFFGFSRPSLVEADLKTKLGLSARAFLVKDIDTGEKILELNESLRFPIASVTKLVTAIVAINSINQDAIVKISKKASGTEGHQGYLSAGEKFKAIDLVNCLLLESSNDAAEALAEHLGRDQFIALMNSQAKSIGMANTGFKDPSGLSKNNVSTSEDLSKLITYIENNRPDILSITRKKSYQVAASSLSKKHLWLNINRLIRENNSYYLGGKDGFTGDALMTFTGTFSIPLSEFDHKRFSIALLRSSDRNSDIKKILNRIIASLRYDDGLYFKTVMGKNRSKYAEPLADRNLSLLFVGDIMLDRGVRQIIESRGGGDYSYPFEFVPFLKDPDIVFGNLEGPISDLGYDIGNTYSFRMRPEALSALKNAGFDVLSIANNHIGDWGLTALEDTINRLRSVGIITAGGGLNAPDARDVKIIEKNGIKVGFLAFSDVGPSWISGHENLPTILLANDSQFENIILNASKKVDYLVVSFHFGEEYSTRSNERQQELAHAAIDAGAKIVIGHHPHVAQELEKYKDGVIAYSLGNFIFDQPFSKETMAGSVLEIILDKEGLLQVNESGVQMNHSFQPILQDEYGV